MPETIEDFTRIQKPVDAMSYRELSEYVTRLEAAGFQIKKYPVGLYAKLALPLSNLIMAAGGDSVRGPLTAQRAPLRRRACHHHGGLHGRALHGDRVRTGGSLAARARGVDGDHHLPGDRAVTVRAAPDAVVVGAREAVRRLRRPESDAVDADL